MSKASKIFHVDNPLNRFLYKAGCIVLLNICFVLCCIPVVTIGAAITGMSGVCYKMKEEPDVKIIPTFFKTFASNFINSTLVWIISAGILSAAIFFFWVGMTTGGKSYMAVCVICIIVGIIVLIEMTYVFMLLARYDNPILKQISNAFIVGFVNLFRTLGIWLIWAVPIGVFVFFPSLLKYIGWIWGMFGFALLSYIVTGIYKKIFRMFDGQGDDE